MFRLRADVWEDFRAIAIEELTEDRMRELVRSLIETAGEGDLDVLLLLFGKDASDVAGLRNRTPPPP
jgi:hypothetical protein